MNHILESCVIPGIRDSGIPCDPVFIGGLYLRNPHIRGSRASRCLFAVYIPEVRDPSTTSGPVFIGELYSRNSHILGSRVIRALSMDRSPGIRAFHNHVRSDVC